jgi:signal transduction histidine kinase
MPDDKRFAELVSLACHDLLTPLATVSGFARTLGRNEFEPPVDRYIEIIGDASDQLHELLKELSLLARIELGRFEPSLAAVDSLELVRSAAALLEEGRVEVDGSGAEVRIPEEEMRRALSQLARAASRHGGFDSVAYRVEGATLRLSPITPSSTDVLLGEARRDLGAVAATMLVRALGGSVAAEDDALVLRLPT